MSTKTHYLESVEIFRDLTTAEVESIGYHTTLMTYQAGHHFFLPDDPSEALYILKHGRVQLYRLSADGRKFVVDILNAGAIFGQMALVGQRLHSTFAEALEDCVICVWSRGEVETLILNKPQVALRLLEVLSDRLFLAEQRLEEATFKRIPARIAGLVLQLNHDQGKTATVRGYTHQQLADMLGTYRETVTQTLNDFKGQKLLRISRKAIEILDYEGLQSVAEG
jgi:CRP/FNR family transcriptional regulator, cyclic AMP receptor protein